MEPNIETRNINLTHMDHNNPTSYAELQAFGWEQVDIAVVGFSEYAVLARDKNMRNYRRIAALDEEYFSLKNQKKVYQGRFVFTTFLMFLLFFVIPGFIYVGYKIYRKKEVKRYNEQIQVQLDTILDEARKLLKEPAKEKTEEKEESELPEK